MIKNMFYNIGCSFVNGVTPLGTSNTTGEFGGKMEEAITKTNLLLMISSHNEIFNMWTFHMYNDQCHNDFTVDL